jgi:hypothetical protein
MSVGTVRMSGGIGAVSQRLPMPGWSAIEMPILHIALERQLLLDHYGISGGGPLAMASDLLAA